MSSEKSVTLTAAQRERMQNHRNAALAIRDQTAGPSVAPLGARSVNSIGAASSGVQAKPAGGVAGGQSAYFQGAAAPVAPAKSALPPPPPQQPPQQAHSQVNQRKQQQQQEEEEEPRRPWQPPEYSSHSRPSKQPPPARPAWNPPSISYSQATPAGPGPSNAGQSAGQRYVAASAASNAAHGRPSRCTTARVMAPPLPLRSGAVARAAVAAGPAARAAARPVDEFAWHPSPAQRGAPSATASPAPASLDPVNLDELCTICYTSSLRDAMAETGFIGSLDCCEHLFCHGCIERWLSESTSTCPLCKREASRLYQTGADGSRLGRGRSIEPKVQRAPDPTEAELQELAEEAEEVYNCRVCGCGDDDETILLCDSCDCGYHMHCLTPQLHHVPAGDWYCPDCAPVMGSIGGSALIDASPSPLAARLARRDRSVASGGRSVASERRRRMSAASDHSPDPDFAQPRAVGAASLARGATTSRQAAGPSRLGQSVDTGDGWRRQTHPSQHRRQTAFVPPRQAQPPQPPRSSAATVISRFFSAGSPAAAAPLRARPNLGGGTGGARPVETVDLSGDTPESRRPEVVDLCADSPQVVAERPEWRQRKQKAQPPRPSPQLSSQSDGDELDNMNLAARLERRREEEERPQKRQWSESDDDEDIDIHKGAAQWKREAAARQMKVLAQLGAIASGANRAKPKPAAKPAAKHAARPTARPGGSQASGKKRRVVVSDSEEESASDFEDGQSDSDEDDEEEEDSEEEDEEEEDDDSCSEEW